MHRRDLLKLGVGAAAAGMLGCLRRGPAQRRVIIAPWTGDDPVAGHRLRDAPPTVRPASERDCDVVVIGGGMAGMTAAYLLRRMNVLLLEQGSSLGGNARSERRGALEFNTGAAYFCGVDGSCGELWSELGYSPPAVRSPVDRWQVGEAWIDDPWNPDGLGRLPEPMARSMRKMAKAIAELADGPHFPNLPYESSTPEALALDGVTFAQWLAPLVGLELMGFVDAYCYSALGHDAGAISAYAGINFCSEFFEPIYAHPAGNAHVVKLLARGVEAAGAGRLVSGCQVYAVDATSDDSVLVSYLREDAPHTVRARRVVLATPYFVSARLLSSLGERHRELLEQPDRASYLVTNLLFDTEVSFSSYDSWLSTGTASPFDDFIPAAWCDPALHQRLLEDGAGQAITLFSCARDPDAARERMEMSTPGARARPIIDAFERLMPGSRAHLREVICTRWGHAFLLNRPGLIRDWLPQVQKRHGPIFLAHSDGQAMPALESAVEEATRAVRTIESTWKKRGD